jgi:hypothetical protein
MMRLPARLDDELASYVAAAGANASTNHGFVTAAAISAITLGSLSLAPTVHAEILYTPANKSIGQVQNGQSTLQIDLNNDGVPDFVLSAENLRSSSSGNFIFHDLSARGLDGNQILEASQHYAANKAIGNIIGPVSARAGFGTFGAMAFYELGVSEFTYHRTSSGFWLNATNRYLGVKFSINGEIHYGWARLNARAGAATLTGYAYETIRDKPIPAGVFETAPPESGTNSTEGANAGSLGALARGAAR